MLFVVVSPDVRKPESAADSNTVAKEHKAKHSTAAKLAIRAITANFIRHLPSPLPTSPARFRQRVTQYRLLVESTSENCPLHLAALHRELARSLTLPPAMSESVPSATASLERRPYSERLHCSGPTKVVVCADVYILTSLAFQAQTTAVERCTS